MAEPKDKSLESWIWDAACSIRGAKDYQVRSYFPLGPNLYEQSVWSVIRELSDKIGEGATFKNPKFLNKQGKLHSFDRLIKNFVRPCF
jgi:hypothetical protein